MIANKTIKGSVLRERERKGLSAVQWCEVTVELSYRSMTNDKPRLSITGAEGYVLSPAQAKRDAQRYWESFFIDNPSELHDLNDRCGTSFRSSKSAAKYVREVDGELHGLDVHKIDDKRVYVTTSVGQIREMIVQFFPEIEPYLQWHLNDMRAGCAHQEACKAARSGVYQVGDTCVECKYSYGSAWNYQELPSNVLLWAQAFGKHGRDLVAAVEDPEIKSTLMVTCDALEEHNHKKTTAVLKLLAPATLVSLGLNDDGILGPRTLAVLAGEAFAGSQFDQVSLRAVAGKAQKAITRKLLERRRVSEH